MIHDQKRERRDWTLLIFIIPIGIFLIIIVGQIAIRLIPIWSVNADMNSNLEPDPNSARPFALLEPILPQILTPMAWMEYYLTPGADVYYPPFLTFSPTASPPPTEATPTATEAPPTQATPTETPSPTSTSATGTASPTNTPEETEPPGGSSTPPPSCTDPNANNQGQPLPCAYDPTTCEDPDANNQGQPLPCTYDPTTCEDPNANNQGQPLPCTYDPTTCEDPNANNQGQPLPCTYDPTTCEDPNANNQGQPLPCTYDPPPPVCPGAHNPDGPEPCDYGDITTTDPSYTPITPAPTQINVGAPPDNTDRFSLSNTYQINSGTYVILGLNVTVEATPDGNYDLAVYEFLNYDVIYLDWFVVGITNDDTGATYYEVFNWGNGIPDNNSNVADLAAGGELDNEEVDPSQLYDSDGAGPAPQTGILIDVDDGTSGRPPPGTYGFVVIISPTDGVDAVQVDAVQTVEVPISAPPAPIANQAVDEPVPEASIRLEEPVTEEPAQTEEASTEEASTEEAPPTP
ncbi:MAG: hypothetical protein DYG86_10735 [Chloroflexi bacterium CFX2]|nr:hypothetical protein [Chloroflexi bacterium CFX2]